MGPISHSVPFSPTSSNNAASAASGGSEQTLQSAPCTLMCRHWPAEGAPGFPPPWLLARGGYETGFPTAPSLVSELGAAPCVAHTGRCEWEKKGKDIGSAHRAVSQDRARRTWKPPSQPSRKSLRIAKSASDRSWSASSAKKSIVSLYRRRPGHQMQIRLEYSAIPSVTSRLSASARLGTAHGGPRKEGGHPTGAQQNKYAFSRAHRCFTLRRRFRLPCLCRARRWLSL